jgi:hypothetical protein
MSATLVLEKKVCIGEEGKSQDAVKSGSEACSCGVAHMATQNAVCRACSLAKSSTK